MQKEGKVLPALEEKNLAKILEENKKNIASWTNRIEKERVLKKFE